MPHLAEWATRGGRRRCWRPSKGARPLAATEAIGVDDGQTQRSRACKCSVRGDHRHAGGVAGCPRPSGTPASAFREVAAICWSRSPFSASPWSNRQRLPRTDFFVSCLAGGGSPSCPLRPPVARGRSDPALQYYRYRVARRSGSTARAARRPQWIAVRWCSRRRLCSPSSRA
jgi:hypothetical protein